MHDEGVQILENLANIRVPVIAAIEGRAYVHSEYALLANVIVAGEGATFHDLPHFAGGIVPGDGIFTTWSYRAGAGRAEAFLLNPHPLTAHTETRGFLKALIAPDNDRILGITVFGGSAGEIMSATQIAMIAGLPYTALRDAILAHPTFVEGLHALFSSEPSGPSERVNQHVAEFQKV